MLAMAWQACMYASAGCARVLRSAAAGTQWSLFECLISVLLSFI
jgi:hypothetical protein